MRQHRGALTTDDLRRLCAAYAAGRGLAIATVGRLAAGHGGFEKRLRAGRVTVRRIGRVAQWLSDHWPFDLDWPADIPRPAPAVAPAGAEPPATPAVSPRGRPRDAVAAARHRMLAAADGGDWPAARRHEQAMLAAALVLGPDGRIADPTALCHALGSPRHIYDDCIRRYAGHPERQPRPATRTGRMVRALRSAGDRRFVRLPRGGA